MELAKKVEDAIASVEPDFVEKTKTLLQKPLLFFEEKNTVIFDGILRDKDRIEYSDCNYIHNIARPETLVDFFEALQKGNNVQLTDENLVIREDETIIKKIQRKNQWFMIDFD